MPDKRERLRRMLIGNFSWRRLILSAFEIYACLLVWAFFFSDSVIFQPSEAGYSDGGDVSRIHVSETESIALFSCTNAMSQYFVLHCHGNAEDIGTVRFMVEEFCRSGFSACTFDYRGYGISDGKPSTRNAFADGEAAIKYLIDQRQVAPDHIIVHGRSVGAAIAIHLAASYDVGGLIAESPFLTAFRARTQIPISLYDKMRNNRTIRKVRCPVLVIHGENDHTIPTWQGRSLFALAPEPKLAFWVPDAGHDDVLWTAGDEYWKTLRAFVQLIEDNKKSERARVAERPSQ